MTNATIDHLNSLARFLVANLDGVTIADINAHMGCDANDLSANCGGIARNTTRSM